MASGMRKSGTSPNRGQLPVVTRSSSALNSFIETVKNSANKYQRAATFACSMLSKSARTPARPSDFAVKNKDTMAGAKIPTYNSNAKGSVRACSGTSTIGVQHAQVRQNVRTKNVLTD